MGRPARGAAPDADWAFHADDGELLAALASGRQASSLRVYFGSAAYDELAPLARAAAAVTPAGPRVLILPGIMGSRLGGPGGLVWIDPLTSLLIAAVIAASTWDVLRDAAHLAIDGVPRGVRIEEVEAYLRGLPGVLEVHDLHVWGLSTTATALTAHLVRGEPDGDGDLVRTACRDLAERFRIGHATLQLETLAVAETCRLRPADVI